MANLWLNTKLYATNAQFVRERILKSKIQKNIHCQNFLMAKNIAHSEILVYKVHTIHKHMTPYYFKALSRQKHGSKMKEVLNLNMMKERSHLRNAPNFEAMLSLNRNTVTEVSLCYRLGSPDPSECERWGGGGGSCQVVLSLTCQVKQQCTSCFAWVHKFSIPAPKSPLPTSIAW